MDEIQFEIYNKEGILTRRGVLIGEDLNIDLRDDDHKLIIRDKIEILHERIIRSSKPTEEKIKPICVTNLFPSAVELFCNTFQDGHRKLHYHRTNRPQNASELILTSPDITVDLEPGEYTFYTSKGSEVSETKHVTLLQENNEQLLRKTQNSLTSSNEYHDRTIQAISELLKKNTGLSVYEAAIQVCMSAKDEESLKASYDIVLIVERIINRRLQIMNEIPGQYTVLQRNAQDLIHVSDLIQKIMVYNSNRFFLYTIDTGITKNQQLLLPPGPIILKLHSKNGLENVLYAFVSNAEIRQSLWERTKESLDTFEEVSERRQLLHDSGLELNEEERLYLAIERFKKPIYSIADAPYINYEQNTIEATILEYELLKRLSPILYLVIKDIDNFFLDYHEIRIVATSANVLVDALKNCILSDRTYFIWMEDDKKNAISSMRLLSANEEIAFNYTEAVRQQELLQYQKRLLGRFDVLPRPVYEKVRQSFDQLSSSSSITANNIYKYLLPTLSANRDHMQFNTSASLIMEDYFSNILTSEAFFPSRPVLNKNEKSITFPEVNFGYVIEIGRFNVGDQEMHIDYLNIEDKGIVSIAGTDYCLISATDKRNYTKSGYVLCSTLVSPVVANWKLGIEVK